MSSASITTTMLSYDFMIRAFAASGIVAIVAGAVGWFLVLRGQTFAGHALSHVGFAGATGAALIGAPPLGGMIVFTLLAGIGMGFLAERISGRDVAIGIVLLGEKQNRWQVVAIVIAAVAIAIQGVALGTLPLVSLGLALTFGFYGYFRKTVSAPSAIGLFVETLLLTPFALGFIAYSWHAQGIGALADPYLLVLVISTGPATAIPLLFFAYAVRQLRMTTIGMFQYISPSLQFLLGVLAFGEHLSPVGLLSFALIWVSLAIFTVDGLRRRPAVPA